MPSETYKTSPAILLSRRQMMHAALAVASSPLWRAVPAAAAPDKFATEVAPGVFVHQGLHELFNPSNKGDISNPCFIVGDDAVAVVDTSGSAIIGSRLKNAVQEVTDRPIRYVINTHMHPDHVFGNATFAEDGVEFVAHHKMGRALAARAEYYMRTNKEYLGETAFEGIKIIEPTRAVEDSLTLDLGGRTLKLVAHPTAHTDNDLSVRCEKTNTLILGDILFSDRVPSIDGSIRGWLTLLEALAKEPADRVVPGHGPASMPWPGAAQPIQRYLERLVSDIRILIESGKTLSDAMVSAGQSEKDAWILFDEYNARNASAAFAELEWE